MGGGGYSRLRRRLCAREPAKPPGMNIGGFGGSELMSMVPQLMRMANIGGGRHGRRHRRR